jgi:hypothetical protein
MATDTKQSWPRYLSQVFRLMRFVLAGLGRYWPVAASDGHGAPWSGGCGPATVSHSYFLERDGFVSVRFVARLG